jgi:hypothetical protein
MGGAIGTAAAEFLETAPKFRVRQSRRAGVRNYNP